MHTGHVGEAIGKEVWVRGGKVWRCSGEQLVRCARSRSPSRVRLQQPIKPLLCPGPTANPSLPRAASPVAAYQSPVAPTHPNHQPNHPPVHTHSPPGTHRNDVVPRHAHRPRRMVCDQPAAEGEHKVPEVQTHVLPLARPAHGSEHARHNRDPAQSRRRHDVEAGGRMVAPARMCMGQATCSPGALAIRLLGSHPQPLRLQTLPHRPAPKQYSQSC